MTRAKQVCRLERNIEAESGRNVKITLMKSFNLLNTHVSMKWLHNVTL